MPYFPAFIPLNLTNKQMKKLLILTAVCLFSIQISKAQTSKGDQTLGINLEYQYEKTSGVSIDTYDNSSLAQSTKQTSVDIGPNYSYFIADKLDIGANLDYSLSNYNYGENTQPNSQRITSLGGDVFIRKYFMCTDKLGFRAAPYLGYTRGTEKLVYPAADDIDNGNSTTNSYVGGVNLDLVFYPSKNLGVAASLANVNYQHYKTTDPVNGNNTGNGVNFYYLNNGLNISVFYVFGK
jgi:hypothetical protein